jgi:fructose-specific phosphotransferase system IIC component
VFAGMLAKSTVGRPATVAAAAAALAAATGTGLPYQSGIPLAVAAGVATGWITEQHQLRHHPEVGS